MTSDPDFEKIVMESSSPSFTIATLGIAWPAVSLLMDDTIGRSPPEG